MEKSLPDSIAPGTALGTIREGPGRSQVTRERMVGGKERKLGPTPSQTSDFRDVRLLHAHACTLDTHTEKREGERERERETEREREISCL
jgi:hypothetical protein